MQARNTTRGRGFTLVELLIMIFIVAVLIGLLTVGMRYAIGAARGAAGTQDVASIKVAVESFKNDFGFFPPLVKDGFPGLDDQNPEGPLVTRSVGGRTFTAPETYLSTLSPQSIRDDDREYLKEAPGEYDYRFSNYSLAYYIMGHLPREIDGEEGPRAKPPLRDGSFDRLTNESYSALFDPKAGGVAYAAWTANENQTVGRWELQDRNGVAYRYYRWLPAEAGDPGYQANNPLANMRVPKIFGDAVFDEDGNYSPAGDLTEFRGAEYAIVAAGANGVFGDICADYGDANPSLESYDEILDGIGKREDNPALAENAGRADNIVEVGR